jgi:hypothetical protein
MDFKTGLAILKREIEDHMGDTQMMIGDVDDKVESVEERLKRLELKIDDLLRAARGIALSHHHGDAVGARECPDALQARPCTCRCE